MFWKKKKTKDSVAVLKEAFGPKLLIILTKNPDPESSTIEIQTYNHGDVSYIPVFDSRAAFETSTKGNDIGRPVWEIDRRLFVSMLRGNETIVLNPNLPSEITFSGDEMKEAFPEPLNPELRKKNRTIILDSLTELLGAQDNDSFVIFEEANSGKFVQFSGSSVDPLLLDLPAQTLDAEEMQRATSLFSQLGYAGPETHQVFTDESCAVPAGSQVSFDVQFERDANRAADFTLSIFESVYGFPENFDLNVVSE